MSGDELKLRIKAVKSANVQFPLPSYAYVGDAGADLRSAEIVTIEPGRWALISTGVSIEIPKGYFGMVVSRSGLAYHEGLVVMNAPGIIDSGYRGEIKVNIINHYDERRVIAYSQRIAQLIIQPYVKARFDLGELSDSPRAKAGHGSSGKG